MGNLCADCGNGYARDNDLTKTCTQCDENPFYYIKTALVSIGAFILVALAVRNSLKPEPKKRKESNSSEEIEIINAQRTQKKHSKFPKISLLQRMKNLKKKLQKKKKENTQEEDDSPDYSSAYIKILFNYIQILAILGTFEFSWPSTIVDLYSANKVTVSSTQQVKIYIINSSFFYYLIIIY